MTQTVGRPSTRAALDPRVMLAMVVAANVLMVLHIGPIMQTVAVVLFSTPLFAAGRVRAGARMLVVYVLLCIVRMAAMAGVAWMPWLHVVGFTAGGVAMMMPCLAAGMSMVAATRIGDLVCVMRRMHVPDAVVIPLVVAMRFFPTIRYDCRMIRQSMRLRATLCCAGRCGRSNTSSCRC